MPTLKQIKAAINLSILDHFEVPIQSRDVKKGFPRPSFFVQFDNIERDTGQYISQRSMTVRIYFYPTDRYEYSTEVLEVTEKLENVFNLNFAVGDRVITIQDTRSQVIDKILEFEFDFRYSVEGAGGEDPGSGELMEELEINV